MDRLLRLLPFLLLAAPGCSANAMGTLSSRSARAAGGATTSSTGSGTSGSWDDARWAEEVCKGFDLAQEKSVLTHEDLGTFLRERNIEFTVKPERHDLHLYDLKVHGGVVRLRVATLASHREAGRHLHIALLEHGPGYWGVHRSNLAVLAAPGDFDEAIGFARETGMACWGVFTAAGRDETFVVPGGYFEL